MVVAYDLDVTRVVGPVAATSGAVVVADVRPQACPGIVGVAAAATAAATATGQDLEPDDLACPRRADVVAAVDLPDAGVVRTPPRERDPAARPDVPSGELLSGCSGVGARDTDGSHVLR